MTKPKKAPKPAGLYLFFDYFRYNIYILPQERENINVTTQVQWFTVQGSRLKQ